ncbi:MAG: MFS transporter [Candidatus Nanopelagicales bacterium]|nr:MFS transporter [Candidatus Nanopelagicales bacterium]
MTVPAPPRPGARSGLRRWSADTFAALAEPNYRRYFAGQAVSFIGTWMQLVAQAWLVLELTGSATWVGLVLAAQTLPVLLVGPYGGLVADRADKRRLLVALQLVMAGLAGALAVLTLTGTVALWHVLLLAAALGVTDAFEKPARQAFVIEIVGPDTLRNAVSLNSVMVNVARVVGPALAGLIIAAGGIGLCFALNAASYLPIAWLLLRLDAARLRPAPPQPHERGQVRAGLAYVRREPMLAVPLLMMAVMGCLTYEFPVTLPVLAKETFAGDSRTYGFMTAAMAVGSVVGGLWTAARGRTGIATLVRGALLFGALVLATALAPTVELAMLLLVGVGAASVSVMARGNATLQLHADPAMRGRVMALWLVAFLGTTPLGGPLAGWVAATFGPRWGLVLGALGCLLAAAIGAVALRRLPARAPATRA